MNTKSNIILKIILVLLLLIIGLIHVYTINNPLLDRNSFRQTQTAITSYYMLLDNLRFSYLTPVLGYPWRVPFEFPIYQYIVAIISKLTELPLDLVGKIVNLSFFYLCIVTFIQIIRELKLPSKVTLYSLIIYSSMPNTIFWSGSFMIEYAALFFTMQFVFWYIRYLKFQDLKELLLLTLFASLALLQKATTVLPVGLVLLGLYIFYHLKNRIYPSTAQLIALTLGALLALIIAMSWIEYTNFVKAKGFLSEFVTSSNLKDWNFGSFSLMLEFKFWHNLILKATLFNTGVIGTLIVITIIFLRLQSDLKVLKYIYISLAMYLLPFFIFKPLHLAHDYYQAANLIFLSFCVGAAIYLIERDFGKGIRSWLIIMTVFLNFVLFAVFFGEQKFKQINLQNNTYLQLSQYIKRNTNVGEAFVLYGLDWSSEIAYYSQRFGVMLPNWKNTSDKFGRIVERKFPALKNNERLSFLDIFLNDPEQFSDQQFGMIILCKDKNTDENQALVESNFQVKSIVEIGHCKILDI